MSVHLTTPHAFGILLLLAVIAALMKIVALFIQTQFPALNPCALEPIKIASK